MKDAASLINAFLDDSLDDAGQAELDSWIAADPENASRFAMEVRYHDRLRDALRSVTIPAKRRAATARTTSRLSRLGIAAALSITVVLIAWFGFNGTSASAAVVELERIHAANPREGDHAYRIDVEKIWTPTRRGKKRAEDGRPPKEPLDGAMLYVRGDAQFVLIRRTRDGGRFVTGSDGDESWSVRPDGSVRVSDDPEHFLRDVPGDEHRMPLGDVTHTFERLREEYAIRDVPMEDAAVDGEPGRLLIAVRKPGQRGPQQVEVTYGAVKRVIRGIRFVDMPFGPDRVTLRITRVEFSKLSSDFFSHTAHHDAARRVEREQRE